MMVLVTGGRGFLGTILVSRLRNKGWNVYAGSSRDFDLTDPLETGRLFEMVKPDLVFHLAAEVGGIGANQANPGRYWYANLLMGAHVLEQSRRRDVDKLVMVGTSCSYPRDAPLPFREESLWDGYPEETNAPYGVAKRALVTGVQAYRDQYGVDAIAVIPANLYGPGDNFDLDTSHVIPAIVRKMVDAVEDAWPTVQLWGDGSATREFLYVDDCAYALELAADRYSNPEPLNLGSGIDCSIKEVAELVADLTGYQGRILWDHERPNGQPRRVLAAHRARRYLGHYAQTDFMDGLQDTIDWYRHHRSVAA